jgi:hypothetical protein
MAKRNRRWNHANFVALPRAWFHKSNCPEWAALSAAAKLLYTYLKACWNGSNNGQITLHYSQLHGVRGLSSSSTVSNASKELAKGGWINKTELGGLHRKAIKYELTGKHDPYLQW